MSTQVEEAMREITEQYPRLANYPNLAGPLALHHAYQKWRKMRCYDRSQIAFGAMTRSGEAGYRISFFGAPVGEDGVVESLTLTGPEMDELYEQIGEIRSRHKERGIGGQAEEGGGNE